jgi:hypothetical protein
MALEHLSDMEKRANQVVRQHIDQMEFNPESTVKVARATSDYIRMKLREEGFLRKILPAQTITGDDLTKQVSTDKPSKVVELEPDSPGAMSIPFGEFPTGTYIHGKRWLVTFSRIATPMFNKDVAELHDYDLDIRQVISDNALKDLQAEEDGKFIQTCNSLLSNDSMVPDVNLPYGPNGSNIQLWETFTGGLTRDNVIEAKKIMMRAGARLRPQTALVNQKTAIEFEKWTREEVGGDMSQSILVNGWAGEANKWCALNWITTIKDDLVPDNSMFLFAAPEFLGRLYFLEDTTMFVKREGPMLSWYAYEMLGGGIANVAAVSRVDFGV